MPPFSLDGNPSRSRLGLRHLRRMLHITRILVQYGLVDQFLAATPLLRPYLWLSRLLSSRDQVITTSSRGHRLRLALEQLGPPFIKLGQLLSTRRDLLPYDITEELDQLQDAVAPFPAEEAVATVEAALDTPLAEAFASFDHSPVASASIAQVHSARLPGGEKVAVKVRRPGIERVIATDLKVMFAFAALAERHWGEARRLRAMAVVNEFAKSIHDELDLEKEGAHASQLRRNFSDHPILKVPRVYWTKTAREVLTLEWIDGIPIDESTLIRARGISVEAVSQRAAEVFFQQVFRDGYFHADMHPGNLFVGRDGQLQVVDFGIIGILEANQRYYLAEMLLAFLIRDYSRAAWVHLEAGYVPSDTDMAAFEDALRAIAEPILDRPLREISMAHLLMRLFQTTRRFHMETQPQLLLLQKTMLNVEGVARQFHPELNIWLSAEPLIQKWLHEEKGINSWIRTLRREVPEWGRLLPYLPRQAATYLERALNDDLALNLQGDQLESLRREIRIGLYRLGLTAAGAAFLLSTMLLLLLPSKGEETLTFGGSLLLGGLGGLLLFTAVFRLRT